MMFIGPHPEVLTPSRPLAEVFVAFGLFAYVLAVVAGTKYVYNYLRSRGSEHYVAVYYNRKLIHVLTGGVVALLLPIFFTSPLIPFVHATILAVITWIPHRVGRLMYWFQVRENMYEVNFCLMWGVAVLLAWFFLGNPIYAQIPILFMSFGDAVTGFTRNLLFKRRTKSWWGNIAMFAVCAPLAYLLIGAFGIPLAAAASIIEHYEFNPVDDNILISLVSLAGILVIKAVIA